VWSVIGSSGRIVADGRGNTGYKAGEKIAIKPNLNNMVDHGTISVPFRPKYPRVCPETLVRGEDSL
jgi:hypothetical protein